MDEAREKLQSLKGRRSSLEALQKAAMGDDGAVSDWLTRHELDDEPRLADQLQVAEGWEKALEAVLGDSIQAVAVSGFEQLNDWLDDLSHGRLALVSPGAVKATAGSKATLLRDHVEGQAPEGLLAGVYVADNLDAALTLRSQLEAHESVVTRDGIWLGPDWLKVAKEEDQEAGILERRRELEALVGEIETLQATVDDLKEQLESTREQISELEEEREEVQRQASRINRELGEINAQVSARQVRLEQITMRRERLGR